jgi:hypothetical protein
MCDMSVFREKNALSHAIFLLLFESNLEKVLYDFIWLRMGDQLGAVVSIVMKFRFL